MIKNFLGKLFQKGNQIDDSSDNFITVQLNEKVMPIDRGIVYEEPIDQFLKKNNYGEITGGGTMQQETGELAYCDIEIKLSTNDLNKSVITDIISQFELIGAPKGSKLTIAKNKEEILFGKKEGLAVYLDGQNLPAEIYAECDINFVLTELHRLMNIEPDADRNWEGEKETALYFFGNSFVDMKNSISEFINTYPLCKGARIVQIA